MRSGAESVLGALVLSWCCWGSPAVAGPLEEDGHPSQRPRTVQLTDTVTLQFSPGSDLYPRYIADPRRPRFALMVQRMLDSEIEEAGDGRIGVMMGGCYGFLRAIHEGNPEGGVQLDIEAGFLGQFDSEASLDAIGWDGFYGFMFSWKPSGPLSFRFAIQHDSAHVGDEYAEETGRMRINYTREELVLAGAVQPFKGFHGYVELGWAYHRGDERLKPWRLQMGLQYESELLWWDGHVGWYAGIDNVVWDERDWQSTTTFQAGISIKVTDLARSWRIGLQAGNGRSVVGEFFEYDEKYVSLGLWMEL